MSISSFHTLSLLNYSPNFPNTIKFHNQIHIQNFPFFSTLKKSQSTISLKPICTSYSNQSHSPFSPKPTSKILSFFDKNLVLVLVGSLVFAGCLCNKPVLAIGFGSSKVEKMEENGESGGEKLFDKCLEKNPRGVEGLKVEKNEKKGGKNMSEKCLEKNPRGVEALKVEKMEEKGEKGEENMFRKLFEKNPRGVEALEVDKIDKKGGENIFKKLFEKNPRDVEALKVEKMGGNGEEDMFEKLLERNPRDVEALKVVFHDRMRKGDTSEAVLYVEKLIEVEPNEVEWRLLQALCYEMMGQFSKAKRLFKDILAKRPLLLRALHGLAMVMHKNHDGPAVFEMLNKALELARREKRVTEERNIRILIAQIHVVKGDLEEGLKQFQVLVDDNPRDFRPYLCQGIIYSLLDKKNEAEEQFEIYRSLVPDEFPQRGFLDDVVLSARTSSHEQLDKEFQAEYSYKN